jgi:hypothetical protein
MGETLDDGIWSDCLGDHGQLFSKIAIKLTPNEVNRQLHTNRSGCIWSWCPVTPHRRSVIVDGALCSPRFPICSHMPAASCCSVHRPIILEMIFNS